MPRLFGERIRLPQIFAAMLLGFFLTQCLWFVSRVNLAENEGLILQSGAAQLRGQWMANTEQHSPLVSLLAALPVLGKDTTNAYEMGRNRWLIRAPFLFMGIMLGGSLWYVARRLYGNAGGYIALLLYIFSPFIIIRSSLLQPDIAAAWGVFGLIFTGIAVAHTLYAPREVVLWNWKRILLLGISIGIALAAQYSTVWLLVLALVFMLWLAPVRRGAAITILLSGSLVGIIVLSLTFVPHSLQMFAALRHSVWGELDFRDFFRAGSWRLVGHFYWDNSAPALLLLLVSLIGYAVWPRTRYFGTTAPLLSAIACVFLSLIMPNVGGLIFLFVSLPFIYVFIAGIFTDLFDTRYSIAFAGALVGALLTHGIASAMGLVQLTHLTR
ncbi:MAG TPA: glycosyltransferase family 39 protein [Candidatus Koribacter sp.]